MKRIFLLLLLPLATTLIACDRDEPESDEPTTSGQNYNRILDPGGQPVTH